MRDIEGSDNRVDLASIKKLYIEFIYGNQSVIRNYILLTGVFWGIFVLQIYVYTLDCSDQGTVYTLLYNDCIIPFCKL